MTNLTRDLIIIWCITTGPSALWCMISRAFICECKFHWYCVPCVFNHLVLRKDTYEYND